MAFLTVIDTSTLANKNINVALLVHTFTNTTRLRKIWINLDVSGIVGNGDYIAYVMIQRASAGDIRESIHTTKPAAAALTKITFGTIPVVLNSATDKVFVYLLGLAGDNVGAVGTITTIIEEWIDIDVNGRVDVGEVLGTAQTAGDIVAILGTLVPGAPIDLNVDETDIVVNP